MKRAKSDTPVFQRRLKQALFENDLTQSQLMEKTGRDQSVISAWVTGKAQPNMSSIIDLCKALNVSADWLLGLDEERK